MQCILTFLIYPLQVYPNYLPFGEEDKSTISIIIGKGKKTGTPLSISIQRVVFDKKENILVCDSKFMIDDKFDNSLMIEIFAGKFAAFNNVTTLLIGAVSLLGFQAAM